MSAPVADPPQAAAEIALRSRIARTAQDFEASFLSVMLGQMFEGVSTGGPFGGGGAEATMRSFMTDAFARSMAQKGGVGLAPALQAQMLKLQGLS